MFFKRNTRPIFVGVKDGRWEAKSFSSVPSARDRYLMSLLEAMGGVNETVPPGVYIFNATRKGFKLKIELEPLQM